VLDLDLESPGISSSLLPENRRPKFGITDWLVEDLVNNGDVILADMTSTSELSRNGDIYVIPAHGANPGEYIAKLGRVWMPKIDAQGQRESWSARLRRLLEALETRWQPDVILIDSRAGIDEVASACLTDLSASIILLFALDADQTWSGYRSLFRHWRTTGVVREIRERLQLVGAMIPELGTQEYSDNLREAAWDLFSDELYDEIPAGNVAEEENAWSFDEMEEGAPHYPWSVRWSRDFSALRSLSDRFTMLDPVMVRAIYGPLMDGVLSFCGISEVKDE
jgi:hypothetical protein